MAGMLFGMDTGIIGGVIVLPAFQEYDYSTIFNIRILLTLAQKVPLRRP